MNNDKKVIDELDEWVQDLQVRLREATALLERCYSQCAMTDELSDACSDLLVTRAPAPAATPALTGAELAERYGFQPHGLAPYVAAATPAPEPDRGFVVDYGLETALYVPPLPQSATPEPSAVTNNPDYCRGYTDGVNDGAREILHGQARDNRLADAVKCATDAIDWHARMVTAESRLAAVRDVCLRACPDGRSSVHTSTADLWPLLSPGGGGTGEVK